MCRGSTVVDSTSFGLLHIMVGNRAVAAVENTLGTDADPLTVSGDGDGHVPRNMRLALQLIDVVQPYIEVC